MYVDVTFLNYFRQRNAVKSTARGRGLRGIGGSEKIGGHKNAIKTKKDSSRFSDNTK
jgi:hypothetical protein